jgi:hypothetical protein
MTVLIRRGRSPRELSKVLSRRLRHELPPRDHR